MKFLRGLQILVFLSVVLSAWAQSDSYKIRTGDTLSIDVVGEDGLDREVLVTDDGKISYPYVGTLKVDGLTTSEIKTKINDSLRRYYVSPQVTVSVLKSREITASGVGALEKPGLVDIEPGSRLLNLIAQCGGIAKTLRPEWVKGTLIRSGKTISVDVSSLLLTGSEKENLTLEQGDVLLVESVSDDKQTVRVIGEVLKPGAVPAGADLSFSAAIAESGGTTPHAALAMATIMRDGKPIPVDLSGILVNGAIPTGVKLMPGDTLVIPTNQRRFSVLGAVRLPGIFDFPENGSMDLLSAIALAGGQTPQADLRAVFILTPVKGQPMSAKGDVKKIDIRDLLSHKGTGSIEVHAGEVVYVSPAKSPTRATDVMGVLAPFFWFFRP